MNKLETTFAGLKLKNPFIVSSCNLTNSPEKNKKWEDAGAAAVVLKSLFEEEIEAWMYGPVVPCVYDTFQSYGSRGIEPTGKGVTMEKEEEALFAEVCRIYGAYSAIGLMNMTHSEKPWKSTPTGMGNVISKSSMKMFFKKRLK